MIENDDISQNDEQFVEEILEDQDMDVDQKKE